MFRNELVTSEQIPVTSIWLLLYYMRFLIVSGDLTIGDLPVQLVEEGHEVRLYIEDPNYRTAMDGHVKKVADWKKELDWVKREDGVIVFDGIGWGATQDELRKEGFNIFGGSRLGEKLERSRVFGQNIIASRGLLTAPLIDFKNVDQAYKYAKKNPNRWVIKQNDNKSSDITYIGMFRDGHDVVDVLASYRQNEKIKDHPVSLHRYIEGIEISVARFFNGRDWVGPIEISFEHKRFMNDGIGPMTSEMGTLTWYSSNEKQRLYADVLEPLTDFLIEADFRGDCAINCVVNARGIYLLEATMRIGTPIIHSQRRLHISPWGEFLSAIARGEQYKLKWHKNKFAIVMVIAVPPFPYITDAEYVKHQNSYTPVYTERLTKKDKQRVLFDQVRNDTVTGELVVSGPPGYVAYTTGLGDTVEKARNEALGLARKLIIPNAMYRTDIGVAFETKQRDKLIQWGVIEAEDWWK